MKCGATNTSCMARSGDICMEHLIADTPSCPSRVPLTNADRIRAMSDEELAGWIYARIRITLERAGFSIHEDIPNESVVEGTLDWLKQEVKE